MSYHTVFDIGHPGFRHWPEIAIGLLFVVVGIYMHRRYSRLPSFWSRHPVALHLFTTVFVGFAVLWTVVSLWFSHLQYERLRTAFDEGDFKVVEGVVTYFSPETAVRKREIFCVGDQCFRYSQGIVTEGFNHSTLMGGPMKLGLHVRVSYIDNTIVKLEIMRPA